MSDFRSILQLKHGAIASIRDYFRSEGVLEVITPLLVKSPAIEPYIDAVGVDRSTAGGHQYFLPTSPEISIKKLFPFLPDHARGAYEISHAFRSEITGPLHRYEFLMVEWYLRNSSVESLWDSFKGVVDRIVKDPVVLKAAATSGTTAPDLHYQSITVAELFEKGSGVKPEAGWGYAEYHDLAIAAGVNGVGDPEREEDLIPLFSHLFDHFTETVLFSKSDNLVESNDRQGGNLRVVALYDYPPFLRGMALLSQDGWAKRTEFFIDGIEVASGYEELPDRDELLQVWQQNNQIRQGEGKPIHPVDEVLLASLHAMEGVAGIAVGLERLLMALYRIDHIGEFFPDHLFRV